MCAHCLTQVVNLPMPNDKTLDLLFANVNRVKRKAQFANNNIVYVEYVIRQKG